MNNEYWKILMNKVTSDYVSCYEIIKILSDDNILVLTLHLYRYKVDSEFLICTKFSSLPLLEKNVHNRKCGLQNVKRETTFK